MINKFAILIISLLSMQVACACTIPLNGPEYDALIDVKKIGVNNTFRLKVPIDIDGSKIQSVHLAYTKLPLRELRMAEFMVDLKSTLKLSKNIISGEFTPEIKSGFAPYIHVTWHDGLCGVVAHSSILLAFDKPNKS